MKVLHLSTFDIKGGAARGAYWLHKALQRRGIDSTMLVARKYGDDPSVHEAGSALGRLADRLRMRLDQVPLRRYALSDESYWTLGLQSGRLDRAVDRFAPDIVHLHWLGGGFVGIDSLRRLTYPLVWTMRDMWPITGGCHYSGGCDGYLTACGRCPQLGSDDPGDISRRVWHRKQTAWADLDLWLVPLSAWLGDCTTRSGLFDQVPQTIIPNGIDVQKFIATDKAAARAAWGLSAERINILFGAVGGADDRRKGFAPFVEAVRALAARGWTERAEVVVFGNAGPQGMPDLGLPVRFVGHVDDDRALAALYSAGDVMVAPSLQEAFGKTLIEAMACGTPVVAFAHGGPVDIVDHGATGYLATAFEPQSLADGIVWCCEDADRAQALGRRARAKVVAEFDIDFIAGRYHHLYNRILRRAA